MFRLIVGYITKAVAVAVPLVTPIFIGVPGLPGDEKKAGAILSLVVLGIVFVYDLFERGIPSLDAAKFRDEYLQQFVKSDKQLRNVQKHLRFNVMLARRRWYMMFIGREFQWAASRGFERGHHHDVKLWLAGWQGVCGAALRDQEAKFVDLRNLPALTPSWKFWQNPFRLFAWQLRRTRQVKAILSVPMLLRRGPSGNPHYVRVGVINVDSVTPEGAEWLSKNWERLKRPLLEAGALLAAIR